MWWQEVLQYSSKDILSTTCTWLWFWHSRLGACWLCRCERLTAESCLSSYCRHVTRVRVRRRRQWVPESCRVPTSRATCMYPPPFGASAMALRRSWESISVMRQCGLLEALVAAKEMTDTGPLWALKSCNAKDQSGLGPNPTELPPLVSVKATLHFFNLCWTCRTRRGVNKRDRHARTTRPTEDQPLLIAAAQYMEAPAAATLPLLCVH